MAATSFESGHDGMVHDAQLDYYGRRLATCSSDKTIKVFDVVNDQHVHLADLRGHEGPVWQVAWAHPKFGSLLASCAFDHRVIVWKETMENQWSQVYVTPATLHTASINSVAWAPHELGLILAVGSSDGTVSILEYASAAGAWNATKLPGTHPIGVTSVSWAPAGNASTPCKRLVTAGCDNTIKIWRCSDGVWAEQETLPGHTDWVRDVSWAPGLGAARSTVASCGQDGQVFVWTEKPAGGWDRKLVHDFRPSPVWRISWSQMGNILAATDGTGSVTLWKETLDGVWQQVSH